MKINFKLTVLLLISTTLSYFLEVEFLLPKFQEIYLSRFSKVDITDQALIWTLIITYIMIAINVCLTVGIFKDLKSFTERGLIRGLMAGLILGLVFGFFSYSYKEFAGGISWCLLWGIGWGLIREWETES